MKVSDGTVMEWETKINVAGATEVRTKQSEGPDLVNATAKSTVEAANTPAAAPREKLPYTGYLEAGNSFLPRMWVSGSAMDYALLALTGATSRAVSNTYVAEALKRPEALRDKPRLRLHPWETLIVLPILVNGNHWIVGFLDLDQRKGVVLDSKAFGSTLASQVSTLMKAFVAHVDPPPSPQWAFELGPCAKQSNFVDSGVFALVAAFHYMVGAEQPAHLGVSFWRAILRSCVHASGNVPAVKLAAFHVVDEPAPPRILQVSTSSDDQLRSYEVSLMTFLQSLKKRIQEMHDPIRTLQLLDQLRTAASKLELELNQEMADLEDVTRIDRDMVDSTSHRLLTETSAAGRQRLSSHIESFRQHLQRIAPRLSALKRDHELACQRIAGLTAAMDALTEFTAGRDEFAKRLTERGQGFSKHLQTI